MSTLRPDDIERLADRLAMIVSGDGEAGNAGVAAAHFARRIGLTGGQLKAIVLLGARRDGVVREPLGPEPAGLRHSLAQLDLAVRYAQDEATLLRGTVEDLRDQLERATSASRVQRAVGLAVVAAAVLSMLVATLGPHLWSGGGTRADPLGAMSTGAMSTGAVSTEAMETGAISTGALSTGLATIRVADAEMRREPDRASPLVTRLPVGAKLLVHRLVWHALTQWAQVDAGGRSGYVSTSEVDLPQ